MDACVSPKPGRTPTQNARGPTAGTDTGGLTGRAAGPNASSRIVPGGVALTIPVNVTSGASSSGLAGLHVALWMTVSGHLVYWRKTSKQAAAMSSGDPSHRSTLAGGPAASTPD